MSFAELTKKTISIISILFPVAFIIVGFFTFLCHILPHQYMKYKMFRLVLLSLQKEINEWTILVFAACILLLLISMSVLSVIKLIDRMIPSEIIEIRINNKSEASKISMTLLIGISGAWAVNHYWRPVDLHPLVLLADALIIIFALLLGWLLNKLRWDRIFHPGRERYMRRLSIILITILILINATVFIDSKINQPKGPNILLIVIDTLRADHLSCYGYERKISPNIDQFASNSTLFKNAISTAPWTTPSIASMFTSQYPTVLGFGESTLVEINDKYVTLAEVLKEKNYNTYGIISHNFVSSTLNFNQGFDGYNEDNAAGHGHISSPSLMEIAITFLNKSKDDPFFLFIHDFDPHYDFILHKEYNYYPDYNGCIYDSQPILELRHNARCMNEDDIQYVKSLYDSEITFTDEYIGILLDKLKELGQFNNTLIVITADHGEEFLERGDYWIGHTTKLYQEQLAVPLIVKFPGDNEGKIISNYVSLIDLMPMIVDSAGLEMPIAYQHDGKPFDFNKIENHVDRPIISETSSYIKLQSVLWEGWKYIYDLESKEKELYFLKNDPLELTNVALENKKVLNEIETILSHWNDYAKSRIAGEAIKEPEFSKEQIERLKSLGYIK